MTLAKERTIDKAIDAPMKHVEPRADGQGQDYLGRQREASLRELFAHEPIEEQERAGHESRYRAVDQRPAYRELDVEDASPHDRVSDGKRHADRQYRERLRKPIGQRPRQEPVASKYGHDAQSKYDRKDQHPLKALPLVPAAL